MELPTAALFATKAYALTHEKELTEKSARFIHTLTDMGADIKTTYHPRELSDSGPSSDSMTIQFAAPDNKQHSVRLYHTGEVLHASHTPREGIVNTSKLDDFSARWVKGGLDSVLTSLKAISGWHTSPRANDAHLVSRL